MKVRSFQLSFDKVLIRFYIMMLSVIIPFFIGIPALAFIALPIFLSAILGLSIEFKPRKSSLPKEIKTKQKNIQANQRPVFG